MILFLFIAYNGILLEKYRKINITKWNKNEDNEKTTTHNRIEIAVKHRRRESKMIHRKEPESAIWKHTHTKRPENLFHLFVICEWMIHLRW